MRIPILFLVVLTALALPGCETAEDPTNIVDQTSHDRSIAVDRGTVQLYTSEQYRGGIVRSATVWPHWFVDGRSELNRLGMRDLDVFATHLRQYPGEVVVRTGGASPDLYNARVDTVRNRLAAEGVDVYAVTFSDGLPHGDGLDSEHIRQMGQDDSAEDTVTTTTDGSNDISDRTVQGSGS